MPALRFSRDSNRSPQMPSTTIARPSAASASGAQPGSAAAPATAMNSVPKTTPPIAPSIVFFGLIDGASGRRPNVRPV